MPFQPSLSDSISFTLNGDVVDGQGFGLADSGFALNHFNEGPGAVRGSVGLVPPSPEMVLSPNPVAAAASLGQHRSNLLVSQVARSANQALGQLRLNHRMTELRRTFLTPRGVRVHAIVDFDFTPRQQSPAPLPEAVTTAATNSMPTAQFLGAPPMGDCIPFQNNRVSRPYEPPVLTSWDENTSHLMNNQPALETPEMAQPYHMYTFSTPINPVQSINDLMGSDNEIPSNNAEVKTSGVVDIPPIRAQPVTMIEPNNPSFTVPKPEFLPEQEPSVDSPQEQEEEEVSSKCRRRKYSKPAARTTNRGQKRTAGLMIRASNHPSLQPARRRALPLPLPPPPAKAEDTADSEETMEDKPYDGRIHSISRRKYGPYTCPKCMKVFTLSQAFASHVLSHYRNETRGERMRRQMAKFKNRNLGLIKSRNGLTVLPLNAHKPMPKPMPKPVKPRGRKRKSTLGQEIIVKEESGEVRMNQTPTHPPGFPIHPPGFPIPLLPAIPDTPAEVSLAKVKAEVDE